MQYSDVIVVGAGPAGSAAAIVAARAGLKVTVLEKAPSFPRRKACGDALTPHAVATLAGLGLTPGGHATRGMAVYGRRQAPYLYDWPATSGRPTVSYTLPRTQFDDFMLAAARAAGATVRLGVAVTAPLIRGGRVAGAISSAGTTWAAPLVVDATGATSRLAVAAGLPALAAPMGVAVRGYMTGELAGGDSIGWDPDRVGGDPDRVGGHPDRVGGDPDQWLHSWLAIRDGTSRLAGYGWVFPLGDGLYNVGVGQLSTGPGFRRTNYRDLLRRFAATLPGLTWQDDDIAGAVLPMGLRHGLYRRGLLIAGDAAGLVSPFDGEGIGNALQSGVWAGEAAVAAAGRSADEAEAAGRAYQQRAIGAWRAYFHAGDLFTRLMGNQAVLDACLTYGLPRAWVMRPVNKLMANLIAPKGGPVDDRLLRAVLRLF